MRPSMIGQWRQGGGSPSQLLSLRARAPGTPSCLHASIHLVLCWVWAWGSGSSRSVVRGGDQADADGSVDGAPAICPSPCSECREGPLTPVACQSPHSRDRPAASKLPGVLAGPAVESVGPFLLPNFFYSFFHHLHFCKVLTLKNMFQIVIISICFSSVAQSCPTL